MTLLKRVRLALVTTGVTLFACACLTACGEPIAATYDGGSVTEETVTSTIENMRTYYELEDDAAWAEFVKGREYDTGANGSMQTAVEKAAAQAAAAAGQTDEDQTEGTAEEMREYVIEQIIRSQLIEKEIKDRKLDVSDEDVDAYVEQQRSYVESRLMEGVFESVLQRQGYKDLDEYREEIREQLKQLKLQNEVSTITTDDGQEISGKTAWSTWFDKLYESVHPKINPAPQPLPYAIVEVAQDSGAEGAPEGE